MIRKKDFSKDALKLKFESDNNFEYGINIRVKDFPDQSFQQLQSASIQPHQNKQQNGKRP